MNKGKKGSLDWKVECERHTFRRWREEDDMVELRYIICNQEGFRSVWFAECKFISALCEFRQ